MVLKVYAERNDMMGMRIQHSFVDDMSDTVIATATNNINEPIKLYYEDNEYQFISSPKMMEKQKLNIKYPLSSKRTKTFGYNMESNGQIVAQYYGEAATCGKTWIFKRNIGFKVFCVHGEVYVMYRVGFPNENCHYYCLYDNSNNIVSIIKRHSNASDYRKATIYIEESRYVMPVLVACTATIVWVADNGRKEDMIDPSAGPYTSIMEEEKKMFDKYFIERVEAMNQ